ncbi:MULTISPECIES: hypothetical protein [unclassified Pannonibacter]|uniref:hypothetical protein n=1 Tax=unclassified Pannonibacter TaxID=2627228 RepID=UPI0016476837|nr:MULTISPECIES: hypothetical protein [unclassified Pannonibacter]
MTDDITPDYKTAIKEAIDHRFGRQNTDDYGDHVLVFHIDNDLVKEALENVNRSGRVSQFEIDTAGTTEVALKVALDTRDGKPETTVTAVDVDGAGYLEDHEITPVIQYLVDDAKHVADSAVQREQMISTMQEMFGDKIEFMETEPSRIKAKVNYVEDEVLIEAKCPYWDRYITATGESWRVFGDGLRSAALDIDIDFRKGLAPTILTKAVTEGGEPIVGDDTPEWFSRLYKKMDEKLSENIEGIHRLRHDVIVGHSEIEGYYALVDVPEREFSEKDAEFTNIDFDERAAVDRYDPFTIHVKFNDQGEIVFNKMGRKSEGRGIIRENEFLEAAEFTQADRKNLRNEMALSFIGDYREEIASTLTTAILQNRLPDHPNRTKKKKVGVGSPPKRPRGLTAPGDRPSIVSAQRM